MAIANQAFQFSLQQAFIAPNNGNGTFGAVVTVPSAKTLSVNIQFISDKAEGNSIYTALAAQIIAVDWQLDGVNLTQPLLQAISGVNPSSSGSGGTEIDTISFSNNLMPYFGIIAQAWGQNGDDLCILIPNSKMMKGWSYKLDFGKFLSPQFSGTAITDTNLGYMITHKNHATKLGTPSFPPGWA